MCWGFRSRKKELLLEKIKPGGEKEPVAVGSQRTIAHRCLIRRCWFALLAWFVEHACCWRVYLLFMILNIRTLGSVITQTKG